jgi:hypothetical protein
LSSALAIDPGDAGAAREQARCVNDTERTPGSASSDDCIADTAGRCVRANSG